MVLCDIFATFINTHCMAQLLGTLRYTNKQSIFNMIDQFDVYSCKMLLIIERLTNLPIDPCDIVDDILTETCFGNAKYLLNQLQEIIIKTKFCTPVNILTWDMVKAQLINKTNLLNGIHDVCVFHPINIYVMRTIPYRWTPTYWFVNRIEITEQFETSEPEIPQFKKQKIQRIQLREQADEQSVRKFMAHYASQFIIWLTKKLNINPEDNLEEQLREQLRERPHEQSEEQPCVQRRELSQQLYVDRQDELPKYTGEQVIQFLEMHHERFNRIEKKLKRSQEKAHLLALEVLADQQEFKRLYIEKHCKLTAESPIVHTPTTLEAAELLLQLKDTN